MKNKITISMMLALISLNTFAYSDISERTNRVISLDQEIKPVSDKEPLVIDGTPTTISQFPYYARLVIHDNGLFGHSCGGSILDDQHILTAAHCVDSNVIDGKNYLISNLGVVINNDSYTEVEADEILSVKKISIHSDYVQTNLMNDIAVLTLSEKITGEFFPTTIPENIAIDYYNSLDTMTVIGMGYTDNNSTEATGLLSGDVNFKDDEECETLAGDTYGNFTPSTQICVLNKAGVDSCNGDSGGPLTYLTVDGEYLQSGLVSYGSASGCADDVLPTVYTEIAGFSSWIAKEMLPVEDYDDFPIEADGTNGGGSGGSTGIFSLLALSSMLLFRRKRK